MKRFEVFDLRELHILRTLTDEELADVKAVHIYGSDRKSNEGLSALYITKNDEVFLAGFDSLVGNSGLEKMPDVRRGFLKRSVKVQELSGKSVQKIVVGAEFGAALSTSNDLYLWGCDVGTGLTQLAFECYYDGSSCSKCNTLLIPSIPKDLQHGATNVTNIRTRSLPYLILQVGAAKF